MFGINEYVFYGATGVCRIADLRMVKLGGMEGQECYVLEPISAPTSSIYIPTSNDEILAHIRPIMSKDQIYGLIDHMPEEETVWISDERERSKAYYAKVNSCDSRALIQLIKTLYLEKNQHSKSKRLGTIDSKIMGTAERLLYEEFAFVLGLDPKDVLPFIQARIPRQAV